jgi:hypothetical protein
MDLSWLRNLGGPTMFSIAITTFPLTPPAVSRCASCIQAMMSAQDLSGVVSNTVEPSYATKTVSVSFYACR